VNADVADPLLIRRLCPSWCGTCLEVDAAEEPGLCRDTVPLEECQQLIGIPVEI
jgi:hypothetical protein